MASEELYALLDRNSSDPEWVSRLLSRFADDKVSLVIIFSYACTRENTDILVPLSQYVPEITAMVTKIYNTPLLFPCRTALEHFIFNSIQIGLMKPEVKRIFDIFYYNPPIYIKPLPGEKMEDVD